MKIPYSLESKRCLDQNTVSFSDFNRFAVLNIELPANSPDCSHIDCLCTLEGDEAEGALLISPFSSAIVLDVFRFNPSQAGLVAVGLSLMKLIFFFAAVPTDPFNKKLNFFA